MNEIDPRMAFEALARIIAQTAEAEVTVTFEKKPSNE